MSCSDHHPIRSRSIANGQKQCQENATARGLTRGQPQPELTAETSNRRTPYALSWQHCFGRPFFFNRGGRSRQTAGRLELLPLFLRDRVGARGRAPLRAASEGGHRQLDRTLLPFYGDSARRRGLAEIEILE
jgi:hypothetical protein